MTRQDNPASTHSVEVPWVEPLILSISHITRYTYEGAVQDSFNEARLQPVTDHLQVCRDFRFRIDPESQVRDYPDFYSNCVH